MYDLSQRDRVRGLTTVVVGALGAVTFMVSTVLPDAWSTTAMFGGAAVATSALTVLVTMTARGSSAPAEHGYRWGTSCDGPDAATGEPARHHRRLQ